MAQHAYNPRQKQIREVVEFAQHLEDLKNRIRSVNVRKMVHNQ